MNANPIEASSMHMVQRAILACASSVERVHAKVCSSLARIEVPHFGNIAFADPCEASSPDDGPALLSLLQQLNYTMVGPAKVPGGPLGIS